MSGIRINACMTLAVMHDGDAITTIEGLGTPGHLHPMQAAFVRHDGFQCGYCTPGQIRSAVGMLKEFADGAPSHATVDFAEPPAALTEESLLDKRHGVFINHDLAEYHIPVNADVGEIDAVMLPEHEPYVNPLGIKGLGEIGIVGAAAAIANAVFDATGIRVREFPVTLDKILGGLSSQAWPIG